MLTLLNLANINSLWGALWVEELIRNHVTYFVVSPGSRSTPLTVAIAHHSQAQKIVCFDERAAAFHALGYGRATGHPAVLVCSSGTAAANYYPAVIEASVDGVPLLILSADRPPELLQTGANQTIQQPQLYGRYVRWEVDVPCPIQQISPQMVLTTVDQAVYRCCSTPKGPVHINCHFRDPLAPIPQPIEPAYLQSLTQWQTTSTPYTTYGQSTLTPTHGRIQAFIDILNQSERGLLVVGQLANPADQQVAIALAQHLQWPLLPDIQSGLRLGIGTSVSDALRSSLTTRVPYFDQLWLTEPYQSLAINTVVQIGGRLVSKRFQQWLAAHPPQHHIVIEDGPERHDPAHTVSLRLQTALVPLIEGLLKVPQKYPPQSSFTKGESPALPLTKGKLEGGVQTPLFLRTVQPWVTQMVMASDRIHQIIDTVLEQAPISEPAIARTISRLLPHDHGLYVGNSMAIRDLDRYGCANGSDSENANDGIRAMGCDRGTSGIEGAIAAAAGFAVGRQTPVTLLLGDLSLLHDLNSLTLLKSLPQPVTVVVINNNGGGIFSFLPIAQFDDVFEPYFGTPHGLSFGHASQMFGLNYYQPQTLGDFIDHYKKALDQHCPAVIEVVSDRQENFALHQQLQQQIITQIENC